MNDDLQSVSVAYRHLDTREQNAEDPDLGARAETSSAGSAAFRYLFSTSAAERLQRSPGPPSPRVIGGSPRAPDPPLAPLIPFRPLREAHVAAAQVRRLPGLRIDAVHDHARACGLPCSPRRRTFATPNRASRTWWSAFVSCRGGDPGSRGDGRPWRLSPGPLPIGAPTQQQPSSYTQHPRNASEPRPPCA